MKLFLKIFLVLLLFGFLAMLYWSSLLVEKGVLELKSEIELLKKELKRDNPPSKNLALSTHYKERFPSDPSLPNLLVEDPFFTSQLAYLTGENFVPHGVRREATLGKPANLHPLNNFAEVSRLYSLCTATVAKLHFGKYEIYAPELAVKIEKRASREGGEEYWVFLRDNLYWAPLNPKHFPPTLTLSSHFLQNHAVTSHDFKFFYDAVMNPFMVEAKAPTYRKAFSDIEKFQVVDDYTFVVKWRSQESHVKENRIKYSAFNLTASLQPLPCFVYQYFADGKKIIDSPEEYQKSSLFADNFSNHFAKNVIVSCGPYLFNGMEEEKVLLKRNPYFHNPLAALVEEMEISFKESMDAVWQDFKAGNIDLCLLSPNHEGDLHKFLKSKPYEKQALENKKIIELSYLDSSYFYLGWNEKNPLLQNRTIRLALTEAIDRKRIVEQNLNKRGIVITGPFFYASPSYDKTIVPWPYDPSHAVELLESEGWVDSDGDGIREKMVEGKKKIFQLSLTYYVKSINAKMICEYIATALKEVGVFCRLQGVDLPDLSRSFEEKNFDALFMGWGLGSPPEDPEALWHSAGATEKGSSNAISFKNREADALIEQLHFEYDPQKREALYHKFHRTLHEEVPYTFLYSPKRLLIYRESVKNIFIPKERQDLVPGATIMEPDLRIIWIDRT